MGKSMRYELLDGNVIGGDTYAEVVDSMASFKLSDVRSRRGYRRATARRAFQVYQAKVDPRSDKDFIETMLAAGLLKEVS